jgi:NhaA family Na+:H+ antiporter
MRATKLFEAFFESEKSSGIVLLAATVFSLVVSNLSGGDNFVAFWHQPLGSHSLSGWVNDGLMAIFFLLIGLELEREVYIGELSDLKKAALPIFGALGGMIVPALIYLGFNHGTPEQAGAGIPMATDIAFAVGIISLLGSRVPASLRIFLTALAVIDDLGAILVIAIFYTKTISFNYLVAAIGVFIVMLIMNRARVRNVLPYLVCGAAMWYLMLHSGVHATITGVLTAFAIPFGKGDEKSPSYLLQETLNVPVAFLILPLFAIANTCMPISANWHENLGRAASLGIVFGLVAGKPLGIWLFTYASAKAGWCRLPFGLRWKHILGAGLLGGIGFTMSIFITLLAFGDEKMIADAKIAILTASLLAGISGFFYLSLALSRKRRA